MTVALDVLAEASEKGTFELEDFLDVHVHDKWFVGNDFGISDDNTFEFVGAGCDDGGALVDLRGIEKVENRDVLDGEDLVHAFEAESALAIQEVGDVGLAESGLVREAEAREIALIDTLP